MTERILAVVGPAGVPRFRENNALDWQTLESRCIELQRFFSPVANLSSKMIGRGGHR